MSKLNIIKPVYTDELYTPIAVKKKFYLKNSSELLNKKAACVSFNTDRYTTFMRKGAYVLLDFGQELCGGVRFITRKTKGTARVLIRFGESVTEAVTPVGIKNSTNDHSPRELTVSITTLSDLCFGQSGFRFVYIELLSDNAISFQNIFAVNHLQVFPFEGEITTNDAKVNDIIKTAVYTLKLCCQNNCIWDGIKRDRLVWSGDMHQEILSVLYMFGNIENIKNSISFVRNDTDLSFWVNWMPSYSAWWIINLCEYCRVSGDIEYFEENADYAAATLKKINASISDEGNMVLENTVMPYFLDWPTVGTEDAVCGTASLFILAAKAFRKFRENAEADAIIRKLSQVLEKSSPVTKQAITFAYLAGKKFENLPKILENGGAHGFSTFMSYYIIKADVAENGKNAIDIIKQYFGAMLERGATTFWEDFNLDWMNGSGRIDKFPKSGQKDIHGDFGAYCYKNFRHSLCHGWSAGLLAFFVEEVIGLKINNGTVCEITPNLMGLEYVKARLPFGNEILNIIVDENGVKCVSEQL